MVGQRVGAHAGGVDQRVPLVPGDRLGRRLKTECLVEIHCVFEVLRCQEQGTRGGVRPAQILCRAEWQLPNVVACPRPANMRDNRHYNF